MAIKETVTVCSACLQASCWQGVFYCNQYRSAGIVEKTHDELLALGLEHPDYWHPEKCQDLLRTMASTAQKDRV